MTSAAFSSALALRLPSRQASFPATSQKSFVTPLATSFFGAPCATRHTASLPQPPPAHRRACRAPSMSLQKVVIAGGSGFIGKRLTATLLSQGASVVVLSRSPATADSLQDGVTTHVWAPVEGEAGGDGQGWEKALADADLVVNLAGTRVVSQWDEPRRRSIRDSRVKSTSALADAIGRLPPERRPRCLVSASGVGYYGISTTAEFHEGSASPDDDFLADVCREWESAATEGLRDVPETRLVVVRIGVVMGAGGGAFSRMFPAFRSFLGGPIGSGHQWVSWVHIDDLVRLFIRAGEDESMNGVYNGTAPEPVRMTRFSKAIAGALNRPNLFPVPSFVIKMKYSDGASVVLDGQRVIPRRVIEHGFQYKYPEVEDAMKAVAAEAV